MLLAFLIRKLILIHIFQSSLDTWKYVFWIGGAVYIVAAIVFMLGGSGEEQRWNRRLDGAPEKGSEGRMEMKVHNI